MPKRLFLSLFLGFFLFVSAAAQTDLKRFVGQWHTEGSSIQLEFSLNKKNALVIKGGDKQGKMKIKLLEVTPGNVVKTKEYYAPTKYTTYNDYFINESGQLENVIRSNPESAPNATIYYRRSNP